MCTYMTRLSHCNDVMLYRMGDAMVAFAQGARTSSAAVVAVMVAMTLGAARTLSVYVSITHT